jgi:hypothetical protein
MKRCPGCCLYKALTEFSKSSYRYDGVQPECKKCRKNRDRIYYQTNAKRRENVCARTKAVRARNQKIVAKHLKQHPCVDCGTTDIRVLEFDHVRGVKVAEISRLVMRGAYEADIVAEIAKCVVRCANCHKIKTYKGSWREKIFGVRSIGRTPDSDSGNGSSTLSPRTAR